MENKSILSKQVAIVLWLLVAAISAIETSAQFAGPYRQAIKLGEDQTGAVISGLSNWKVYFFLAIFVTAVVMYFKAKNKRFVK